MTLKDDRAVQPAATLLPIIAPWEGSSEIDIRGWDLGTPDIILHSYSSHEHSQQRFKQTMGKEVRGKNS